MTDHWDFYVLRVDQQPASIFVDLGISKVAPIKSHASMAFLCVRMLKPTSDGLSSQEEFSDLCALEDKATEMISRDSAAIFVGRNTSDGKRKFYFYTADVKEFKSAAKIAMLDFPTYNYQIGGYDDSEWRTYFEFLLPSPTDRQRMMNRRVLEQLEKRGDNLDDERRVDHLVFLPTSASRLSFIKHLKFEGFIIDNAPDTLNDSRRYSIEFSRIDRPAAIDDVVVPLFEKLTVLGGDYDGWGCEVSV